MDRTKRQAKAARKQAEAVQDNEVLELEEVVFQARERVQAAKASKSRAAALRQELLQLQEEEESIAADQDAAPALLPLSAPAPTDPGALVAASLSSAVNIYFYSAFLTQKSHIDSFLYRLLNQTSRRSVLHRRSF